MYAQKRIKHVVLAITRALGMVIVLMQFVSTSQASVMRSHDAEDEYVYLPLIVSSVSPQGSYTCGEYENQMVWYSEVITLLADGRSLYDYGPPYLADGSGTWQFSTVNQVVTFTNFRWPTATFTAPDYLNAYQLISDYEVELRCRRKE